ncbi:uncharacterized protein LOC143302165 [Babylonia areolata]|uniref:uncharacterized protein LOC143302165 n=1 Tax=Babylonia areolata TaxID=304850 RepID=UPI003FD3A555
MKQMKKMKEEQTYGWYPSVRDIYLSKNQPAPYHLECLYKFKESGYHNPIVEPPEPAFVIRGITPTPPPSRPATSGPASGRSSAHRGGRSKSVPVPKFRPVPKMSIPTPLQAWKRAPSETSWGVVTPGSAPDADKQDVKEQMESKPEVQWPTQQIKNKYDKPFVPSATAEEVFGTPLPPREPGAGGDSGYVFIPTGDGGVEVHSPPTIYWPDSYPRTPTPQHSVSSRASLGSADGITSRKKVQEDYQRQMQKEKEEKRKQVEKQRRFDNMLRQQQYQQKKQQPRPPSSAPSTTRGHGGQTVRRERIQSATTRRDKTPVPQRPVYSARPSRCASDTAVYTRHSYQDQVEMQQDRLFTVSDEERLCRAWEEEEGNSPGNVQHRPMNPMPPTPSLEDLVIEEDRSPSPDYQQVVDRYGWRAEVHGDPYNIKKTTKRLPYTVKCEEPVVPPEPPSVHMESKETFFLNTIPRRLATFDVHQDWLSEGLCAKRMELQKREGVNYRYKNFAFAY